MKSNSNRNYESIEFQVEENLANPKEPLIETTPECIFNDIFIQGVIGEKRNAPMEVLAYELDTENFKFFNDKKASLISGLIKAYKNHYPMVIFPDMIWMLILQTFSRFLDKYHELVRHRIVNFEGKKELCVNRFELHPSTAQKEDWRGIFNEFTTKIGQNIGEDNLKILSSDFSTTNPCTLTTSQVSIMTGMKHYFEYSLLMGGCGVSKIELQGSLNDWKKILEKTKSLEKFGLGWWTKEIVPIIKQIIITKQYYYYHGRINSEIKEFWKKIIRIKGKGDLYDPHIINGWIVKFFPDIENRKVLEEIKETNVENQILSCPMKLIVTNFNGFKTDYDCSIESGFFGMEQDKKTFKVRPILGYALVVVNKKKSQMSIAEKEEILQKFFS